jgi:hypothetical protein
LEILEQRLPPGDAVWGALLGWGAIAASDAATDVADRPAVLAPQFRLLADLDEPEALLTLTEIRRSAEAVSGAVPSAGQAARAEPGLPEAGSAPAAPASRLLAQTPGNPGISAPTAFTAPPGPGNPAPAFAAVAGAVAANTPPALAAPTPRPTTGAPTPNRSQLLNNLSGSGLSFERNVGQTASRVDYLARTGGGTVFLTPTAAVFAVQGSRGRGQESGARSQGLEIGTPGPNPGVAVYMDLVGSDPAARPVARDELPGKVNYFIGNDPGKWHTNVPTFGRVEYANVYPGISIAYYGGPDGLEYDFILSPGADAHAIALKFEGTGGVEVDAQGDLVEHTAVGDLVQRAPVLYQEAGGQRQPVTGRFAVDSGLVRFDVGAYDHSRPLVIDPLVMGYSTFLGGSAFDEGSGIAVDGKGAAYVVGQTVSSNFPTTPGAFDTSYNDDGHKADVFVAKLNPAGTGLVYGTYLGGSGDDAGYGVAVDGSGHAYVTGRTASTDFPISVHFGTGSNGGAFVTKLDPTGSALVYSATLAGALGEAIAVDPAGEAFATGKAGTDFPVTPGAFQTGYAGPTGGYGDAFVAKLNPGGTALAYATLLGGWGFDEGHGIAVDGAGHAYVTGATGSGNFPTTPGAFQTSFQGGGNSIMGDAFVVKLSADGTALEYGTFLGGPSADAAQGIAVDASGNAYVTGTASVGFPVTTTFGTGGYGAFFTKVNPTGSALVYSALLSSASGEGIAVDSADSAYITGNTGANNLVTTPNAFDKTFNGVYDAIMAEVSPDGTKLVYSTYLGGTTYDYGYGIAVDGLGNVYLTGSTESGNFPTTPGALEATYNGGGDAFVTKFRAGLGRAPAVPHAVLP